MDSDESIYLSLFQAKTREDTWPIQIQFCLHWQKGSFV